MSKISSADGTRPMIGPKNGMIFVTPTIAAISTGYGSLRISIPK